MKVLIAPVVRDFLPYFLALTCRIGGCSHFIVLRRWQATHVRSFGHTASLVPVRHHPQAALGLHATIEYDRRNLRRPKTDLLAAAMSVYRETARRIESFGPDVVLILRGISTATAATAMAARDMEVPCLFFENGPLASSTEMTARVPCTWSATCAERHTLVWDSGGPPGSILDGYLPTFRARAVAAATYLGGALFRPVATSPPLGLLFLRQLRGRLPLASAGKCSAPGCLLVLQSDGDTVFIRDPVPVRSNLHLVEYVTRQLRGAGWGGPIVVRQHPASVRVLSRRCIRSLGCREDNSCLPESLGNSRIVIAINSGVGLQAMIAGRPVVLLGDSSYSLPGHFFSLADVPRLVHDDARVADPGFLLALLRRHFLPGSMRGITEAELDVHAARLEELL